MHNRTGRKNTRLDKEVVDNCSVDSGGRGSWGYEGQEVLDSHTASGSFYSILPSSSFIFPLPFVASSFAKYCPKVLFFHLFMKHSRHFFASSRIIPFPDPSNERLFSCFHLWLSYFAKYYAKVYFYVSLGTVLTISFPRSVKFRFPLCSSTRYLMAGLYR